MLLPLVTFFLSPYLSVPLALNKRKPRPNNNTVSKLRPGSYSTPQTKHDSLRSFINMPPRSLTIWLSQTTHTSILRQKIAAPRELTSTSLCNNIYNDDAFPIVIDPISPESSRHPSPPHGRSRHQAPPPALAAAARITVEGIVPRCDCPVLLLPAIVVTAMRALSSSMKSAVTSIVFLWPHEPRAAGRSNSLPPGYLAHITSPLPPRRGRGITATRTSPTRKKLVNDGCMSLVTDTPAT